MADTATLTAALSAVKYPGFDRSIVDYGFVHEASVHENRALVRLKVPASAQAIHDELRGAIEGAISPLGLSLDLAIEGPETNAATTPECKNLLPTVAHVIMVSSGKGGVGKSTSTVNLAISLAAMGLRVGVLDADIYGPNVARMMGLEGKSPEITPDGRIEPMEAYGTRVISMANLVQPGQSLIWRGAMIMKVIQQLLEDVAWGALDALVIDMPPGTGDAQLTLAQSVPVSAGVCVTTPQVVALDDARRSLDMFKKLNIPVAGLIENMSGFICPESGKEYDIFGRGTASALALEYSTEVLAQIPIEIATREGGDEGKPIAFHHPSSESAKRLRDAAQKLWSSAQHAKKMGLATNSAIQPRPGGGCH